MSRVRQSQFTHLSFLLTRQLIPVEPAPPLPRLTAVHRARCRSRPAQHTVAQPWSPGRLVGWFGVPSCTGLVGPASQDGHPPGLARLACWLRKSSRRNRPTSRKKEISSSPWPAASLAMSDNRLTDIPPTFRPSKYYRGGRARPSP